MNHAILLHEAQDDVGVAVRDLQENEEVGAVTLEGEFVATLRIATHVPLGHKVSMHDLPAEKDLIEYGRTIGRASQTIPSGAHVHTHNLKTLRWSYHE